MDYIEYDKSRGLSGNKNVGSRYIPGFSPRSAVVVVLASASILLPPMALLPPLLVAPSRSALHGPLVAPFPLLPLRSTTCLLVALADGDIRLYDGEKNLLHTLKTREPIAALRFGPYAREDGALAVISKTGAGTCTWPRGGRRLPFLPLSFALW